MAEARERACIVTVTREPELPARKFAHLGRDFQVCDFIRAILAASYLEQA